jgi:predicted transcriptional regulator
MAQPTREVMDVVLSSVDSNADISELYRQLTNGHNAVVVLGEGKAVGVPTKTHVMTT